MLLASVDSHASHIGIESSHVKSESLHREMYCTLQYIMKNINIPCGPYRAMTFLLTTAMVSESEFRQWEGRYIRVPVLGSSWQQ
jgi:hypothetical protein